MIKSILQFEEVGVKKLSCVLEKFIKEPEKQAEFIYGITDSVVQLGLDMITETFESMDEELRKSAFRKTKWVISRRDETSLITSLGTVKYHKTLFKNKQTGEMRASISDHVSKLRYIYYWAKCNGYHEIWIPGRKVGTHESLSQTSER